MFIAYRVKLTNINDIQLHRQTTYFSCISLHTPIWKTLHDTWLRFCQLIRLYTISGKYNPNRKLIGNDTDGNTEVIRKKTRIPRLFFRISSFFFFKAVFNLEYLLQQKFNSLHWRTLAPSWLFLQLQCAKP